MPWSASLLSRRARKRYHYSGAVTSLLAVLLALLLPMLHAWDIPAELVLSAGRAGAAALRQQTPQEPRCSAATTPTTQASHDPWVCPVCQLLTQTRQSLIGQRPVLLPPQPHATRMVEQQATASAPPWACAAPRAPPILL